MSVCVFKKKNKKLMVKNYVFKLKLCGLKLTYLNSQMADFAVVFNKMLKSIETIPKINVYIFCYFQRCM